MDDISEIKKAESGAAKKVEEARRQAGKIISSASAERQKILDREIMKARKKAGKMIADAESDAEKKAGKMVSALRKEARDAEAAGSRNMEKAVDIIVKRFMEK